MKLTVATQSPAYHWNAIQKGQRTKSDTHRTKQKVTLWYGWVGIGRTTTIWYKALRVGWKEPYEMPSGVE